ncbi:MAG: hypothetical protein ACAI35_26400 [Candidatus Methylacidiphilales bacterium]
MMMTSKPASTTPDSPATDSVSTDFSESEPSSKSSAPRLPRRRARRKITTPGPGSISPAVMAHLSKRFPPDYIAGKIGELLEATHIVTGGREVPDNRARESGLKLLMTYLIGLPVQRKEIVQLTVDSLEDLQRRAQQSPALRAAVEKVVGSAPGTGSGSGPGRESVREGEWGRV